MVKPTHHAVGVGVAGLGHRQALNDLRSHPGESSHHCHVGGVGEELRRPKVANLKSTAARTKKNKTCGWIKKKLYDICVVMTTGAAIRTFSTLSAVITTVEERAEESRCV